jgi:metallo-beta-lactamase family protein
MKLSFHGAVRSVTGSRHLLELDGHRILFDCGLVQGRREESFRLNRRFGFSPKDVHAVVLSHAHIDHVGALPALVRAGFSGPVYATPATADLADVMLQDSAFIHERDVEIVNRRQGTRLEPLYTIDDARAAIGLFRPVPYWKPVEVADGARIAFHDAGHMLGSSVVRIEARHRTLLFSGDLGRDVLPILRTPELLSGADAVIVESTYGDRDHPPEGDEERELETIIRRVTGRGGKIIIPAFAVGRTQHLTYRLKRLSGRLPEVPVFVDSPLASDVTEIYRRHPECHEPGTWKAGDPFGFGLLRYVRSVDESKRLNELGGPAIIIAASGMCEHGRILHHLAHHAPDPRNALLFVGYQAEHTLGRRLVEGRRQVRVLGRDLEVKAEVIRMDGLSAHADRKGLRDFILATAKTLRDAFVVHGEPAPAESFAGWIRESTGARTLIPALGEPVEF